MKILVTGVAGFIGYHVALKLLKKNISVIGIDNLNNYYDVNLKKKRLENLKKFSDKFTFKKMDLNNFKSLNKIFKNNKIKKVIHLAAQAGLPST